MPTDLTSPYTAESIVSQMVGLYEEEYYRQTGERKVLRPADSERIELYTAAYMFYLGFQWIDYCRKQNLVRYAEGAYLDELGIWLGVERAGAKPAGTTIRLTLSDAQPEAVIIPVGTRVSPGNQVFFATDKALTIPAGTMYGDVPATALVTGSINNGYLPGQITTLVDPIGFVKSVINLDTTQGGAEIEDDEHLRERILLKPYSLSTAGPVGAYLYWIKSYSQQIESVVVSTPAPTQVKICLLLKDGETPSSDFISRLQTYLLDYRPMTDQVTIVAPSVVEYSINLTYYIDTQDANSSDSIQTAVESAIEGWRQMLAKNIGKNINTDELIRRCKEAGALRLEINEPVFREINQEQIAVVNDASINITYGGLEDD